MIPQGMGDPGEGLAVEIHVAGRIGEDRVIAPHHPVAPYLIREAFEGLDPLFERRQVLFQVGTVGIERILEIIVVTRQLPEPRQHRRRVLRPEYDAVHDVAPEADAAERPRVEGIGYKEVTLLQAVENHGA